jgi:hypothetical protein
MHNLANANPLEVRVNVSGNIVVFRVHNLVVFPAIEAVTNAIKKAVADFTQAQLDQSKMDLETAKEANNRLVEIDKLRSELENASDEDIVENQIEYNKKIQELESLRRIHQIVSSRQSIESGVGILTMARPVLENLCLDLLKIVCPDDKISIDTVRSLSMDDIVKIAEAVVKVNRLDELPKKPLAQGLVNKLKDKILSISSGLQF